MDARKLMIEQVLTARFDLDGYHSLCKALLNGLETVAPHNPPGAQKGAQGRGIASVTHVGRYRNGRETTAILAVELMPGKVSRYADSPERRLMADLLGDGDFDAAIAAFFCADCAGWKLSFLRADAPCAAQGANGLRAGVRRYSYPAGPGEPCHTALKQLFPIFRAANYRPTLAQMEEAFGVEQVTKDFFHRYRDKYFDLRRRLEENEAFRTQAQLHGFTGGQFAKKLMGQLVFLYFLQKKGWLGAEAFARKLTARQYQKALSCSAVCQQLLPLVYARGGADEYRLRDDRLGDLSDEQADALADCFDQAPRARANGTFIRDLYTRCHQNGENFFNDYLEPLFYDALSKRRGEHNYYSRLHCKIPYLNGGLFDPLAHYDWQNVKFNLPNELFSNIDTAGDGEADGILDIFDRYHFTMKEDEPQEREVAVDPEMLGKIFESLLDADDRKSKGAFYTPREIVRDMCRQSLTHYLVNETGAPYQDAWNFILYGQRMQDADLGNLPGQWQLPDPIYARLGAIDEALDRIKIADPAVGSGAFALGMLSEIVKMRSNITHYFALMTESDAEKARMIHQRAAYRLKEHTIRHSIYGMDIDPSAVDVARLRLWLSIVVDAPPDPAFETVGAGTNGKPCAPPPLPDLESHILCANSLIDGTAGEGRFDIVLGNPPYVDSETMVKHMPKFRTYCAANYQSAKGNWDLFVLFIELGYILSNASGIVTFIIPNKIISADYAKEIRKIISAHSVSEIKDYSRVNVFKEAAVYPATFLSNKNYRGCTVNICLMRSLLHSAWENRIPNELFYKAEKWDGFFAANSKVYEITEKICANTRLGTLSAVRGGSSVSEAYALKEILTEVPPDLPDAPDEYFKLINTGTIDRYASLWKAGKTRYIKQVYLHPVVSKADLKRLYPKRYEDAQSEKIIIGGMNKVLECYYDTGGYLAGKSTVIVSGGSIELAYVTGLLNSRLMTAFYKIHFHSLSLAGGYYSVGAPQIRQLPIAMGSQADRRTIADLVSEILRQKRKDPHADTAGPEGQIDRLVYKIYGLTEGEAAILTSADSF